MATYLDQFSEESLLVIKKPPISAPVVQSIKTAGEDDFLEERFICFAYRYRYADGEYSATSQFSEPSFIPEPFDFSFDSFLNEGMVNSTNAAIITFNSGGPLVVGIDLLFKESNNFRIKVIEKLNKSNLGYADNQNYTYTFNNSKIFTLLPESEILRFYDNVPLTAKSQTVMGNRLVYGNYTEGYDLKDSNNNPVKFEYDANLVSENIGQENIDTSTDSGQYSINSSETIPDSVFYVDLDGLDLIQGASFTIDFKIEHNSFSGDTPFPAETTSSIDFSFTYVLPSTYNSVYELSISPEFIQRIGGSAIEPVATACDGTTLTDQINCALPQNLDSLIKNTSGITGVGQSISIISTPASNQIGLQIVAMNYVDDIVTPTQNVYEYYSIIFSESVYRKIANTSSLHSNRGYEIGIIYMDEFNRSSTALVSPNNTVQIPCANSADKNTIRVSIPTSQIAPSWASKYKFVIKADEDSYETIYSNIFFEDPASNAAYFLLEGENAAKIQDGDRLIVKSDISGPTQNCVYTTVLEKEVKVEGFLTIPTGENDSEGQPINIYVPSGPYMKLNPSNFSIVTDTSTGGPFVVPGPRQDTADRNGENPFVAYPVNITNPSGTGATSYVDYTIPEGSRINIDITQKRTGKGSCPSRSNVFRANFVSTQDYVDFKSWWDGDNIGDILINDSIISPESYTNEYVSTMVSGAVDPTISNISTSDTINYYQFYTNTATGQKFLMVTGPDACASARYSADRRATVSVNIEVIRYSSTIVFETIPSDALPDVWYENNLSFNIGPNGEHYGNVQNQNLSLSIPGIVSTGFFNCFAFGNGVESYKIRDSISAKSFNLGNRVTTTSAVDYKRADRFADLTYSGVFNDETNVNKLNEFNVGLLNFKPLEESFGSIQMLFSRQTDILTLQENKISYVLAGKNLLSDAAGESVLTSVPEVLGLQIARIENYGISLNPESFVAWGYDKYFTDSKRGALIQLQGTSFKDENLNIISEAGMRSWFRDLFLDFPDTQKLGAFDPYMNEYVLSSNNYSLPIIETCVACGIDRNLSVSLGNSVSYCVDLSQLVGDVTIDYVIPFSGKIYAITAVYNGITYTSGEALVSGSFTFPKNIVGITEAVITVSTNSVDIDTVKVTVNCPLAAELTLYNIAITSNNKGGQFIHNEYRWQDGAFASPLHSNLVEFSTGTNQPLVSQYSSVFGPQGAGIIPADAAVVTLFSNKLNTDDFVFNATYNKFKYLRSNTLYQNNSIDIQALLAASTDATPIITTGAPDVYSANFTMPSTGNKLYLIWDYRESTELSLCYSPLNITNACCDCVIPPAPTPVPVPVPVATTNYRIEDCNGAGSYNVAKVGCIFNVSDVVQYIRNSDPNTVYCATVTSITFPSGGEDATLFSCNTYECGDIIHCDVNI